MLNTALFFTAGAMTWSFAEYYLHRFDGHGKKGTTNFSKEHIRHHAEKDYFLATADKVKLALPVVGAGAAAGSLLMGPRRGLAYTAGFAAAYTGYEVLHRRLHTHAPKNAYGRWARKHHFAHHFNNPKTNHGVTSPLWDIVFGTHDPADVVKVPRRHAMRWLVDEDTGQVKEAFAKDYELKGRPVKVAAKETAPDADADLQAALAGEAPAA